MRMSSRWPITVLALLVVSTAAHATYRIGTRGGPMLVSMFEPGREFPRQFRPELTAMSSPDCRIFVAYASACPYCRDAAYLEAASDEQNRMAVTWISMQADSTEGAFRQLLRPESHLLLASDTKAKLKIQAVPAAFLVDRNDIVREVWVYSGDESHVELRERCV
jgi:hypothetical protein